MAPGNSRDAVGVRPDTADASAYAPLRQPVFRALWIASLVSNLGTWLQNVGAGWLMTGLTPSPLLVALVQAVTTLPVFLLALPAGALADVIDRRCLLLAAQGWMLAAAAALAAVTAAGVLRRDGGGERPVGRDRRPARGAAGSRRVCGVDGGGARGGP
jgi:hypothetical protein